MPYEWKTKTPTRIAPIPYADDLVVVVGEFEAEVTVGRRSIGMMVYCEPQRPPDPSTGTTYGRRAAVTMYIACEDSDIARSEAAHEAMRRCDAALDMLVAGMCPQDVYERSGSKKWWDDYYASQGA